MKNHLALFAVLMFLSTATGSFATAGETLLADSSLPIHPSGSSTQDGEIEDIPRMLEQADASHYANGCLNSIMAAGCRISSQIPFWNLFVASFTTQAGIACPIGSVIPSN
jgi:hypothetical protein